MKETKSGLWKLLLAMVLAAGLFAFVYWNAQIRIQDPAVETVTTSLSEWTIENSSINGAPMREDKSIYGEVDTSIYDVYISVFPTKDENGDTIDLSAFGLHTARDHSYNPTLNCNIQILSEGEKPGVFTNLEAVNATIRVRGNSSRGDLYKSYKVKLNDDTDEFLGQKVLNINKHSEDICKIATKLQTDLLRTIPDITSYRTYFMRVWIRDASLPEDQQEFVYQGLYTEMEQPNKSYLESHGLSSSGTLYKARDFAFLEYDEVVSMDDPDYDEVAFESHLSMREGTDHEKLLEMIDAVNDETRDFGEVFSTYFNEDNYLTWLCFNILMGNDDILNHNYMIYNPANSKTWYFCLWDFDETLKFGKHGSLRFSLPVSLRGIQKLNMSVLNKRYFRMEGSIEKIEKKADDLMKNYVTRDRIVTLTNSYMPVLEKTMALYPDIELLKMEPSELPAYIDGLYDGIYQNYQNFKESIQYPSPMFVSLPERNEDGTVHFTWEPSFSYQGRTVTYGITLYSNSALTDVVFHKEGILENYIDSDTVIAPGTYYLSVTATDSAGHTQVCLEHFENFQAVLDTPTIHGFFDVVIE